jgi:hypothetical protein
MTDKKAKILNEHGIKTCAQHHMYDGDKFFDCPDCARKTTCNKCGHRFDPGAGAAGVMR